MIDYKQHLWGFSFCWADTVLYAAHMMVVKENEKTPYVYHKKSDKTIFVLQGTVMLYEEGKSKILNEGDKYHILPKTMYCVTALKGDATLLEASSPIIENDIVVVEE